MAHMANTAGLESNSSPKPGSRAPSLPLTTVPAVPPEKPSTWRMQSEGPRRYQLFPKMRQSPASNNSASVDLETAATLAMGQNGQKNDAILQGSGLKLGINQQSPAQRHKASASEPSTMTTVQGATLNAVSGRLPFRGRFISAPEDGEQNAHIRSPSKLQTFIQAAYKTPKSSSMKPKPISSRPPRLPSPKRLAPLVILETNSEFHLSELRHPSPFTRLRSESTPQMRTYQPNCFENSPMRYRLTPTATTTDLRSCPTSTTTDVLSATALPTPTSAPIVGYRSTPKPWEGCCNSPVSTNGVENDPVHSCGHRRFASESSSIMNRGRPRKRTDSRHTDSPQSSFDEVSRSKSSERREFEDLPQGWKPRNTVNQINANDIAILHQQALGQAEEFEVLRVKDVETLSMELRQLDEHTGYLRRTYNSLRVGRRNLHSRIYQYLRSPRVARLSRESILKQEEALCEIDVSIDDWAIKLERAENRRTRIQQKLLEHIAAAAILQVADSRNPSQPHSSSFQDISTPPRSPSKPTFSGRAVSTLPSPRRVTTQLPSLIQESPLFEEAGDRYKGKLSRNSIWRRSDVESIRIYAGDELFSLLADVEEEMFSLRHAPLDQDTADQPESQRIEHERQKSYEMLNNQLGSATIVRGLPSTKLTVAVPVPLCFDVKKPLSPPASTPPTKNSSDGAEILLTNAVFKP